MNQPERRATAWRTSSYSTNGGDCVEIGTGAQGTLIRDTKHRAGGTLQPTDHAWRTLLTAQRRGH